VGQRLGQRLVSVEQVRVLPDDGDRHLALGRLDAVHDALPAAHVGLAVDRQPEMPQHLAVQPLGVVVDRHLVDGLRVERGDHALRPDVAEQRDLAPLVLGDRPVAAAQQHLRLDADREQLLHAVLGGLGLQLARGGDEGHQRQVHEQAALRPHLVGELADRLQERQALDVAHGAADLDDDEVVAVGLRLDHLLDLVGDVRNDLHGAAEVVAPPFRGDHVGIDPPRGPIVGARRVDAGEPLVVA
jgi:hypothetical protein